MKLTAAQKDTLQLLMRSPDRGDGWRSCSGIVFEKLILPMPDELVEKDMVNKFVRLTDEGSTLVEWAL